MYYYLPVHYQPAVEFQEYAQFPLSSFSAIIAVNELKEYVYI